MARIATATRNIALGRRVFLQGDVVPLHLADKVSRKGLLAWSGEDDGEVSPEQALMGEVPSGPIEDIVAWVRGQHPDGSDYSDEELAALPEGSTVQTRAEAARSVEAERPKQRTTLVAELDEILGA